MTGREILLAASLLERLADELACAGCNDWEFPADWTEEERYDFVKRYHDWNDGGREFDPKHIKLPDFAVAGFLAHMIKTGQWRQR